MKRLALALAVGLMGVGILMVVFKIINTPRLDVLFQPSAAYNHPINGLSFRFDLTNQSSSLVEVEVLRTETRTTNGWQILTNFSDPELLRFGAEAPADVPLPVGPQTWR